MTLDAQVQSFLSVIRKVSKKIGALKRAGNARRRGTRRQYYLAVISGYSDLNLQYSSNGCRTTLSVNKLNARKNCLIRASKRGMWAVVNPPTTTSTSPMSSLLNIVPPDTRMHLREKLHSKIISSDLGKLHPTDSLARSDLIDFFSVESNGEAQVWGHNWTGRRLNRQWKLAHAIICDVSGATSPSCKVTRAIRNVHDQPESLRRRSVAANGGRAHYIIESKVQWK